MPTISEFFGILIRMYYGDHNPPHFHAYYGRHEAIISIEALVIEWAVEHRQDLLNDWKLAEQHQPLNKIEPLE